MDTIRTHYDDLEVAEGASPEIIRAAYRYLSQKWLPDNNPERRDEAARITRTINEAYAVLSDPELRQEYDAWLATQRKAFNDPTAPSATPQPRPETVASQSTWVSEPAPQATTAAEPTRLTRKQIWIWIACLAGLRMLLSFVSFAQLAASGKPTPPEFEFVVRAILTAIIGLPLLLGLCYVVGWCLTKVIERRAPRAKGVLIAAAVLTVLAFVGEDARFSSTPGQNAAQQPTASLPSDAQQTPASVAAAANSQPAPQQPNSIPSMPAAATMRFPDEEKAIQAIRQGDYATAVAIDRRSAEEGNAGGQHALGTMYEVGAGVSQDYAIAAEWYHKAAEQGDSHAQTSLGIMYLEGRGVSQNYLAAANLFRNAAAQGNYAAQNKLGEMYRDGQGVPHDPVVAYALFDLSIQSFPHDIRSDNPASKNIINLVPAMTTDQIEAGKALTRKMQQVGVLQSLDTR